MVDFQPLRAHDPVQISYDEGKQSLMNRLYNLGEMIVAALMGAAFALLLTAATGLGSSTTVVQQPATADRQPAKITVNVQAPPAVQQLPQTNAPLPPADPQTDPYGVPQYGYPASADLHACALVSDVVTSTGQFIPVSPEHNVGNDNTSCILSDANSAYSVMLQVTPNATTDDYYSSLQADQNYTDPLDMTQGPITYPDFSLAASNITLAYQYSGYFKDGGAYQTIVFLATGLDGNTYLVNATLLKTYNSEPSADPTQLVSDAALSLP